MNDLRKSVGLELLRSHRPRARRRRCRHRGRGRHEAWIATEVLAVSLNVGDTGTGPEVHSLDIDGEVVSVRMTKA